MFYVFLIPIVIFYILFTIATEIYLPLSRLKNPSIRLYIIKRVLLHILIVLLLTGFVQAVYVTRFGGVWCGAIILWLCWSFFYAVVLHHYTLGFLLSGKDIYKATKEEYISIVEKRFNKRRESLRKRTLDAIFIFFISIILPLGKTILINKLL